MSDWIQLGDGNGEPWYRELDEGEVQLALKADEDVDETAIGFQYSELDRLPRYEEIIDERDALRAALLAVEFVHDGKGGAGCAWCGQDEHDPHHPRCQRQLALKEAAE